MSSAYEKTKVGEFCNDLNNEVDSEEDCQEAAKSLDLPWNSSFDSAGAFPACFYVTGEVYFNRSPNPERKNANPPYASAICVAKGKYVVVTKKIILTPLKEYKEKLFLQY